MPQRTPEDLERELLTTARSDRARLEQLLHPDFFEFGASGRKWSRGETIDALLHEERAQRSMIGVESRHLALNIVLLTYTAERTPEPAAPGAEPARSLRSSIWIHDKAWRLLFHQGTPVG